MILQIIQLQQTAATRLQMGNTPMKQYFTFFMSILLLLSAQVLSAQTWTGAANSNWNNPANWSTLAVPNGTSNVEIVIGLNKPIIMAGTAAVAKSVFVEIGSELTINAGASLSINGATNIGFFNLGTVTNDGTINIGNVSSITNVGLQNDGVFKNTSKMRIGDVANVGKYGIINHGTFDNKAANGEIEINRTTESALFNEAGIFNNEAKITIGSVANIGATGLENKSIFNNAIGSEIKIDRSSDTALRNLENANFDNYGKIHMGSIASIGGSGIINNGNFSNNIGGDIKVERFKTFGVYNYLKSFSNAAKISIDGSGSPAFFGLDNFGTFTNTGSSEITIDHVGGVALRNLLGVFTNEAKIFIGNTGSVGNYGLMNYATFKNTTANGEIQIDRTIEAGLYNETGTFDNAAKITIGFIASLGEYGIQNKATLENKTGGDIQIDRTFYAGLYNEAGTFTNAAKITVGAFNSPGQGGIANSGDFYNIGMGEINIDRATLGGLYNYAGLFSNAAKIRIGAVALTGESGIYNLGNFENKTGGEIQIDRTTLVALACGNGSFKNAAKIKIGSIASVGNLGINTTTLFTNNLGGDIQIDRTLEYAISHLSSDFINLDKITIGAIATVGLAGIYNKGSFFNNTNGDIKIDRFSDAGFINFAGSCSNTAKITIGAATVGGQYSVTNSPSATFVNSTCAITFLFAPVKNQSNFYQNGLLSVTTPNPHINSGNFSNNGIIAYPNGNPIPNVTNYDIIVLPISSNCGATIANALQLGANNDYLVNTTWYKDAAMTLPAGTYNQATNIFTLTSWSAPLFISIQSYAGGCTRRVPIFITVNDATPPTITCPANIVRNTDPNQCYATVTYTTPTATDNCAAPTVAIVPPSLASGAQFPKGVNSVTWQATDGAGLTHRCTFTVTVNGGAGSLNITCPANQIKSTDLGQCSAVVTYVTPTSGDNCGGSPVVTWVSGGTTPTASGANSISTFQKGVTTVQWKATDASNTTKTCTFRVTINDTQLPSITCPTNQTLATTGSSCASATFNYAVTATDNCMPAPTVIRTSGLPSGSSFPKGTSNMTWRAIDGAGNSKTCSFSVTVADNVLPTITCPTNVAVTAAPGQCSATAFYPNPTATDNCAVQSLYLMSGLASGSMYPHGVTNNVWVATDNSGQSATCAFTVTVTCGSGYGSIINNRAINDDIQGVNSEITMRLSPNPAITSVAVALEGLDATGGELIVMDAQGKSVWQQVLTNISVVEQISVSEFTAGIYFVMVRSDRGVVTKRLVVSRD